MAGGFGRGFAFLQEQKEAFGSSGDYTPKLWLYEKETAKFWFLTDGDDVVVPLLHSVPTPKKGGGTWNKDVLCERRTFEDPVEQCSFCVAGANGPWPRGVFWVYVDFILRNKQDEKRTLEAMNYGGNTVYRQKVEAPWLLVANPKLMAQVVAAYSGTTDILSEDTKVDASAPTTLLNRPFTLERLEGSGANTQNILKGGNPTQVPSHILAARQNVPDLSETVELNFADGKKKSTVRVSATSGVSGGMGEGLPVLDDAELVSFD